MTAIWKLARTELRTRWLALLALGAIVAVASAVLLTAVTGARRTSTALERFRDWSDAADAYPQSSGNEEGVELAETVQQLPYVTASTTRFLVNGFPAGGNDAVPDFAMYTDPSNRYGVEIDRPRLLRGRMPNPDEPDEVVVDELTAELVQRDVGDHVELQTWAPGDLETLFEGTGYNGPPLDLTVVGVSRSPAALQGEVGVAQLTALLGPNFLEAHPGISAWPPVIATRLEEPERNLRQLSEDLAGSFEEGAPIDIDDAAELYLDSTQRSVGALTVGLWIFALVAGLAAAVTVGQAMSRQIATATKTAEVTRALGMTTRARSVAAAIPSAIAGVLGVMVGGGLAILLSPLLPTGLARRAEIDPGVWIDPWALFVGSLVAIAALLGWAAVASWRAQRRVGAPTTTTQRPSAVAARLAGWGVPAPIVTGVRHAFEGYGGLSVPVRSALVAATIAVAGIVGAGVVATSVDGLTNDPARWGWTWSSEPDAFGNEDHTEALANDDRLDGVAIGTQTSVEFGSLRVAAAAVQPIAGAFDLVLTEGRAPAGPSEVALGKTTMEQLDVSIGDTVSAVPNSGEGTLALTVVGRVVMPVEATPGEGAMFTVEGLERANRDDPTSALLLRYPEGADANALEQELREDYDLAFPQFSHPVLPASIRNLDQGRGVAVALAVFFAVLGIAGLFHALTVSTRGRRRDFAVLHAIGFRRRQLREAVLSQSTAIAIVGLAIGTPVGVIVGRAFWDRLVSDIGTLDRATTPWLLLFAVIPAALAAAAIIAALPARSAARASTGQVLRES